MENQSAFESFEMHLTNEAQGFLRETAKWATFLSILGFIGLGFMLLGGLFMLAAGGATDAMTRGALPFPMSAMGVAYLLFALLYFFPVYYLYKFASNTKDAIASQNTQTLTSALQNLKSHYKFIGILTIVLIVTYIIGIIVMATVFASAMGGRM